MTTPTQAQIEAAAKVLNVSYENKAYAIKMAKAALTAAAEVGEKDLLAICLERIEATGKALEAATIERCAQVADKLKPEGGYVNWGPEIAAAIRALKNEP